MVTALRRATFVPRAGVAKSRNARGRLAYAARCAVHGTAALRRRETQARAELGASSKEKR